MLKQYINSGRLNKHALWEAWTAAIYFNVWGGGWQLDGGGGVLNTNKKHLKLKNSFCLKHLFPLHTICWPWHNIFGCSLGLVDNTMQAQCFRHGASHLQQGALMAFLHLIMTLVWEILLQITDNLTLLVHEGPTLWIHRHHYYHSDELSSYWGACSLPNYQLCFISL